MSEFPQPQRNLVEQNSATLLATPIQRQVYELINSFFAKEALHNRIEAINIWGPPLLRHSTGLFKTKVNVEGGEHKEFKNPVDNACIYVGSLLRHRLDDQQLVTSDDIIECNGAFAYAAHVLIESGQEDSQDYSDMRQLHNNGVVIIAGIQRLMYTKQPKRK